MTTLKRKLVALATLLALLVPAIPAVAYSNLCITHLGWMSGPAANQRHSVGYLVAPNYTHKNVIIQQAGPGYWYNVSAYPKKCI